MEDDPGVARLEQLRLERAGYEVATAASAEEGLNRVAGGGIDLIVLDQNLSPGTSGLEFFRQVKAAGHNVPAILVTGMQEEGLLVEALRPACATSSPRRPTSSTTSSRSSPACSTRSGPSASWPSRGSSRGPTRSAGRELEREIAQRKQVEQALREAEENLRRMVESVKDVAIFTVDLRGRIVTWNPGAEHLFGYAERETIGREVAVIFTPEDRDGGRPRARARHRRRPGHAADERWHLRKDGSTFFASGVMSPIYDEEDGLCGFTKVARDITERKRAEEAVREAAVRLKAIVDTAVDGIITIDERGIIESMNPAAERIFGHAHHEVVGRDIAMLMPDPDRDEYDGYLESYLRSGQPRIIGTIREVHGRRKDGSIFPMELAVSESRLGARRIFTGIVRDITEYKRAVEERTRLLGELEAERALLNTLLDNAPVGFGFFDHDLRYVRLNPALAELDGLPSRPTSAEPCPRSCPACRPRSSTPSAACSAPAQSIVNKEFRGETPQPRASPATGSAASTRSRPPTAPSWAPAPSSTDIDDRKRMEEALKEADQRKDQFLAMLAHELRNPLAPISNAVQIMKVQGLNGPNFRLVGQGHRGPGQAHDPDGRRPAGRLADHPRQGRPPEGAGRAGDRGRPGRRGQPAPDRGLPAPPDRRAPPDTPCCWKSTRRGWPRCSPTS